MKLGPEDPSLRLHLFVKLAGHHQELAMTHRYMHLSPAALDAAIRLLCEPQIGGDYGDIMLETGVAVERKANG